MKMLIHQLLAMALLTAVITICASADTNAPPQSPRQDFDAIAQAQFFSLLTNSYDLPLNDMTLRLEDFKGNEALKDRVYSLIINKDEPGIYYWKQWDDSLRRELTAVIVDRTSVRWANITTQGTQMTSFIKVVTEASLVEQGQQKILTLMFYDGTSLKISVCVSVGA